MHKEYIDHCGKLLHRHCIGHRLVGQLERVDKEEPVHKEELDMRNKLHQVRILLDYLPGAGPGPKRQDDERNE